MHRKYIPIYIQQDATLHSLFISGDCSTCFVWYFHPSSGAHTTVSTASGTCHTVTAICRYYGRVGTGLSVLWLAYATHSTLKQQEKSLNALFIAFYDCKIAYSMDSWDLIPSILLSHNLYLTASLSLIFLWFFEDGKIGRARARWFVYVQVFEPKTSRCVWLSGIPMMPSSVDEDHSGLRLQSFPIAASFFVTELH